MLWILGTTAILGLVIFAIFRRRGRTLPLPPKLKSLDISQEEPWKSYGRWSASLGPLVCLPGRGRPIIVINTVEAVTDLLEKRRNFSSKPRWPMAELLGRQNNVGFQYYGERLRKSRRILHRSLNANTIRESWPDLLNRQSLKLLQRLAVSPGSCHSEVESTIQELIVCFTYGSLPSPEYLQLAMIVADETGVALQPGRWMVNALPWLIYIPAWIPGAGFQHWAREARNRFNEMIQAPFCRTKLGIAKGIASQSFVREALEADEEEDLILSAAGSLFSAGTDTLVTSLLTLLALISRHAEVQERAYQEISALTNNARLPTLSDQDKLIYIDCIIQEAHRFNPSIPLVTHSNIDADQYGGCEIPAKSWIIANVWSMLHSEETYPEPEKFIPDRFVPVADRPSCVPRDPRTLIYGFGRRVCPGVHLANSWLYLTVAQILAVFQVFPNSQGTTGNGPPIEFTTGLVAKPKPFPCMFKLRAAAKKLLLTPETL